MSKEAASDSHMPESRHYLQAGDSTQTGLQEAEEAKSTSQNVCVTPDVIPSAEAEESSPEEKEITDAASDSTIRIRRKRSAARRRTKSNSRDAEAEELTNDSEQKDTEKEEPANELAEVEEIASEDLGDGEQPDDVLSPEVEETDRDGEEPIGLEAHDSAEDILPAPSHSRLPSTRDSFQLYVREISHFPLLKPEEEHELAVKFRDTRDKKAAFRLISSHLRLVVKIAVDFQRRWMQNVLDLVQEGNVGLMHALYKFDPDKGIKFSYYASFWIKAYILKFIMDNFRMVKIGTTQVQRRLFFNLSRERQKLIAEGFDPDAEMLSKRLGVSKSDIQEMDQRMSSGDVSLNVPVGDDSDSATRMDFLPALGPGVEDSIASSEISDILREKLKTILPQLNEKEIYILNHRLLTENPETLRKIGEHFNVTRERVRQLEIRLLEKIKKHLSSDIKDFSDTWIKP